jgi:hypothetical protein
MGSLVSCCQYLWKISRGLSTASCHMSEGFEYPFELLPEVENWKTSVQLSSYLQKGYPIIGQIL